MVNSTAYHTPTQHSRLTSGGTALATVALQLDPVIGEGLRPGVWA